MKKIQFNLVIIICLGLLLVTNMQAENPIGAWKTYLAYQDPVLVAETDNLIFAVYKGQYYDGKTHNDGSLFSYDPEDGTVETYSSKDGLNGLKIKKMAYSPEAKVLVLVYEEDNIDLFYGRNNVVNISLKNKPELSNKTINNITFIGKYAYLSAGFGIIVLDLERKEIKNSYFLNINTMAFCQLGNDFYIATGEGIKKASITSNLNNIDNWKDFKLDYSVNENKIEQLVAFKDQLVFYETNKVCYVTKNGTVKLLFQGMCRQLSVLKEELVLNLYNAVYFYTDLEKKNTKIPITASCISAHNSNNIYWITQPSVSWVDPSLTGLIAIKRETDSNEYSILVSGIKINSPVRNYCEYMTCVSGKLFVVGGSMGANRRNKDGTFMIYENKQWTNFDKQAIDKKIGLNCNDFVSVVVDPRDSNHYFVASWGEGLLEFRDTVLINHYTDKNTNNAMQTANPSYFPENYIRTDGLAFDKNNNLYMVHQLVTNGLAICTADSQWISPYYPPLAGTHPNKVLITRNNQKWINIYDFGNGIFVLDDNNTIDDSSDDTYYYSKRFVDQQGTDIKAFQYNCLAEDLDGIVWVGTDNGPISFSSAAQVGEGVCNRIIATDQYSKGYYPLEGQKIMTIAIDGANRKWMGTQGNGVFVVNNSGETLTVENFNTNNSPLISDNIRSIAINNKTGEVFIGTDCGIVSYTNEAIEGSSDYSNVYAFPNPVKPANDSQVTITGLVANSPVKITDMAGNLIQQGVSLGGQYSWKLTNRSGAIVKAGIYLVLAALPDGSQGVVTKIMVIK
ncbi:MAG: hypothetical protein LBP72_01970 [Dysgonamonadaceae bacterium]|jgi:hypothetical protein|nr:hypothetical protein [Dysgonamonadaceae bacterium]